MTSGIGDWIARQGGLGAVRLGPRPRPVPGATLVETIRQLSRDNGLFTGEVLLADRPCKLASITCPFFNVYGTHDHVIPPKSVAPLASLVALAWADTLATDAGHIGMLAGRSARKQTLPSATTWLDEVRKP